MRGTGSVSPTVAPRDLPPGVLRGPAGDLPHDARPDVTRRARPGTGARRHLRLDLRPLARRVLPAGPGAPPPARVPGLPARHRGDQRDVLLAAAGLVVPAVGGRDGGGLPVRGEGQPLHHAHEEAAQDRRGTGPLPRLRSARARGEARADALAAAPEPRLGPRPDRGVPDDAAAQHRRRRRAGPRAHRPGARPVHRGRRGPPAAPRPRGPAPQLPRPGGRPAAPRARRGPRRLRRRRHLPDVRRRDHRPRPRPPARRHRALPQRLRRGRPRRVGRPGPELGGGRGDDVGGDDRPDDPAPPAPSGREVLVHFDNDGGGHAPLDALALARRLGEPER